MSDYSELDRAPMKKITVAFDVDGTLRCNHTETCEDSNERIVELVKIMAHMKNTVVIVWSGGGREYAERFVRLFKLESYVDKCMSKFQAQMDGFKPDIAVDDIQETALGKVNLIVREK